ncbi:MAG: adenylate kinase [Bacteroidetes bacterium]|nr:adenylate kinase [Bacteroidota bacterium]
MRIILFGPPGVGKGTQAKILSGKLNIVHIASGDILRAAIANGTELGRKAKSYMDRGELVPDDVVIGIIQERLKESDARNGFILDGFPRTLPQAEALEKVFEKAGIKVNRVVSMEVDRDVLLKRLTSRRVCRSCGAIFNLSVDKVEDSKCPKCGGELYQRDDDREETILRRFDVYQKQTRPVKNYYAGKKLLVEVDGIGEISDVTDRLNSALRE